MYKLYLFRDRAFSFSKPAKSFLLLNFASVLLFAVLYRAGTSIGTARRRRRENCRRTQLVIICGSL